MLAILCSGGDCPGMNACIEFAYMRTKERSKELIGVVGGFNGLAKGEFLKLEGKVHGISRWGGTILRTSRGREFVTPEGSSAVLRNIRDRGIEGVIVLGGDGSLKEGVPFLAQLGVPTVGIPCTIDDDIPFTTSIGFDTACNKALQLLDSIKDTADALPERIFVLETLGGRTGHIALRTAYLGGADFVCIPEIPFDEEAMAKRLRERFEEKGWAICVVAEGVGGYRVARRIEELTQIRVRLTSLGHSQRGGSPSAFDRFLARMLSESAVDALLPWEPSPERTLGIMLAWREGRVERIPIEKVQGEIKKIDESCYYRINGILPEGS